MSNLLLSDEKRNHFEQLISKTLSNNVKTDVSVTVNTAGEVILSDSINGLSLWDTEELFEILQQKDFSYNHSAYKLTLSKKEHVAFSIERDGW